MTEKSAGVRSKPSNTAASAASRYPRTLARRVITPIGATGSWGSSARHWSRISSTLSTFVTLGE